MIERLGPRVDVAANGEEVIEMLALLPYDLVFMDCEMPEMDGYAATAEIRRGTSAAPHPHRRDDRPRHRRTTSDLAAGMSGYVADRSTPPRSTLLRRWVRPPAGRDGSEPASSPAVLDPGASTSSARRSGTEGGALLPRSSRPSSLI